MTPAERLVAVARAEIGYREKENNSLTSLYDKPANAGRGNYTKYGYEMDTKYAGFYNGKKNGYAWCDVFVDWCHCAAFGADRARALLCQPEKSLGAGVQFSRQYFRAAGRLHDLPRLGAQVFFGTAHTGIVTSVEGNGAAFSAIEGNTGAGTGVVSDGGGVWEKSYVLQPGYHTFGWQNWDDAPAKTSATCSVQTAVLRRGCKGSQVMALQALLNLFGGYGLDADGDFGPKTESACRSYQKDHGMEVDGVCGAKTWGALLGGRE